MTAKVIIENRGSGNYHLQFESLPDDPIARFKIATGLRDLADAIEPTEEEVLKGPTDLSAQILSRSNP